MFMRCGSIIALCQLYDTGGGDVMFFSCGMSLKYSRHFCILSSHGALATMNQLTHIRNKSAESLKTNKKSKKKRQIFSEYVGAF